MMLQSKSYGLILACVSCEPRDNAEANAMPFRPQYQTHCVNRVVKHLDDITSRLSSMGGGIRAVTQSHMSFSALLETQLKARHPSMCQQSDIASASPDVAVAQFSE